MHFVAVMNSSGCGRFSFEGADYFRARLFFKRPAAEPGLARSARLARLCPGTRAGSRKVEL